MLKNMLKAASQMMSESKEPKVQCAKTIIDEIVSGIEGKRGKKEVMPVMDGIEPVVEEPTPIKRKPGRPAKTEQKYEVLVNEGRLVEIAGLSDDAKVEINGVVMTHAEAKGKPFQNGRII